MTKNYSYPLDPSWSTDDIAAVLSFLNQVEAAYESRSEATNLLQNYQAFKRVVPSKMQEKQIDREFEASSGYSIYRAVQAAKEKGKGWIFLGS
ncbi:UPF0223 family protein [Streptococcus dentapri]|uniref:UPF0223 protein ACFOSE_08220 n=1 Tax=Streptococcus dentapri TaxID=573564 RepID=A0ABV8D2I2_9STRE